MEPPLVTIVTPSYNQGDFIRATIESVLAQDYPNLEYVIMDGGSTDHTPEVVAGYADRLTWISEPDRGQAHAINKGIERARGEIVAWLNSDDILLPGALTRAVRAFERMPHAAAVYGEGYLMDREGNMTRRFPATEPFNLWKLVYLSDYVLQQSAFFRRAAWLEAGGLDESLHYVLDWDLLIRLGSRYGLEYVPEYFGALREYAEAKSFAGGWARIREMRRMLERHTGLKRAPGVWTYGLETAQRLWMTRLERRSPRWLRAPVTLARLGFYTVTAAAIMMILRHAQGLYPDGWASDRLKWMLPEGNGEVCIRGTVPRKAGLDGQELLVKVDGRRLGPWPAGPGDFEIRFPAPKVRRGPLAIEIHARRYRRPRFASEPGLRRMAFILKSVNWA